MSKKKRFNMVLAESTLEAVERLADEEGTTVVDVLRRFIRLGIYVSDVQKNQDAALVIRRGDHEQELLIL